MKIGMNMWAGRASSLTAMVAAGALAFAGVAMADDISNDLDSTIDAVAEVMPLNVGGASGTTSLYITARNGDGKNGCNLTSSSTLVLAVQSSNPAVATVSPSSVTFASCSDTRLLTVTPVSMGSATVGVTQTSNTTGGTFNLAPATFTAQVAPPANTAPSVTVSGVDGGASYAQGSVPAATCSVSDAEDGPSSFAATLSAVSGPYSVDGIGTQSAGCSYTDAGGLTASASETYSIVDLSAPVIGQTLSPSAPTGSNGWYTGDVSLTWAVNEPESPSSLVRTGCADQNVTADQAATTYTCSASSAGGTAAEQSVTIKRDSTAPTVQLSGGPASTLYFGESWSAPTCTASDSTSGLTTAGCVVTGGGTTVGAHSYTATATDNAGNTATTTLAYEVLGWTTKGYYSPVDMGGVLNTVKGGSTVPLKFELFVGTTELETTSSIASFKTAKVSCVTGSGTEDAIEIVSTGGTSLRYDATAGQFIQNWKTPTGAAGSCYSVTVTAQDGSSITALFKMK